LKQAIKALGLNYPVIYDGGIYDDSFRLPLVCAEWDVHQFPSTFLIDPQGVIVANNARGDNLGPILDFYLNQHRPAIGIEGFARVHDDGQTFSIFANVMNQGHEPVDLRLSASVWEQFFDAEGFLTGSEQVGESVAMTARVSFNEFGDAIHEFVIRPPGPWHTFSYALFVTVPGAGHILDHRGRAYALSYPGDEYRRIPLERIDGRWVKKK
jgi:hypothetical protein